MGLLADRVGVQWRGVRDFSGEVKVLQKEQLAVGLWGILYQTYIYREREIYTYI